MVSSYPRESVEFQPVRVTQDGAAVTTDLSFAVVRDGQRPVEFTAAVVLAGVTGIMVSGLEPGTYRIYAKLTTAAEIPVIDCGYFYID